MSDQTESVPEPFQVTGALHEPSVDITIKFPGITVDLRIEEDAFDDIDQAVALLPEAIARTLALMDDDDEEDDRG